MAAAKSCQGCGRTFADGETVWTQDWIEVYPKPRTVVHHYCDACNDGPTDRAGTPDTVLTLTPDDTDYGEAISAAIGSVGADHPAVVALARIAAALRDGKTVRIEAAS